MMQFQEPDHNGYRAAQLEADLACLWPSNTPEDAIRRKLACILIEDPEHRLRVAHLEPLLHMALGPQQLPCSSGRLQALLTDPSTAKIFLVDFSAQVPDWRSRVVFMDVSQLSHSLNAARQQQHADAAATDQDDPMRLQRGSSSGCSESAGLEGHLLAPSGSHTTDATLQQQQQRQQGAVSSNGSFRPAPLALESIFGNSPALGSLHNNNRSSSSAGGIPCQPQQPQHSAPDGSSGSMGPPHHSSAQNMSSSLFGGSFEVPHAIASCWADHQGSFSSAAGVKNQAVKALAAADGNCGSSSMASGSSTRSCAGPGAPAAAAAAAAVPARPGTWGSRLRNASSCLQEGEGPEGSQAQPAAANSIEVCTPRSGIIAAPGGAQQSPLHSSADCEEDVEYSEAALVFGSVNGPGGSTAMAAAAAAAAAGTAAEGGAEEMLSPGSIPGGLHEEGSFATAPTGEVSGPLGTEESFSMQGVDWSCLAELQQQQQQGDIMYHYQQQQAQQQQAQQQQAQQQQAQQQQQQQQALLFGLDDFGGDGLTPRSSSGGGAAAAVPSAAAAAHARSSALAAAAATGALTARRLLMEHAGLRDEMHGSYGNPSTLLGSSHHSPHHHMAALAGSFGALGAGSAPATLQQQHEQLLLAAAAAASGSGGAFGAYGSDRLLPDQDYLQGYGGLSSSQHMAALAGSFHGNSYGSGGLLGSDSRSLGSGIWASPAALQQQFLLQQQQAVAAAAVAAAAAAAAQNQHQALRGSLGGGGADSAADTGHRSDQLGKEQHPAGSAGRGVNTPRKGVSGLSISRPSDSQIGEQDCGGERNSSSGGAGGAASALTPRLTGWASVAAKQPSPGSNAQLAAGSNAQQGAGGQAGARQQQQQAGGGGGKDVGGVKAVTKLPARVQAEVHHLVAQFQGVLKVEDFDDGVVHQLNAKHSEEEAVAAVRHIAHYELGSIQHMAAYLNHLVKHYNHNAAAAAAAAAAADSTVGLTNALAAAAAAAVVANSAAAVHAGNATMQQLLGATMLGGNGSLGSTVGGGRGAGGGAAAAAGLGAFGGQIRLASVPVSTKSMLQKLPLKVFKQIELLVQNCAYLEWRHFDGGVIKVLSQLSKLCVNDVFEELELLAATDLSNVEYMPAYLNKRLNNKLWSRRKAEGHVPA